MATKNLGKVAFVFKGDYSDIFQYNKYDVVFDGESSFISIIENNLGNSLSDTGAWKYLCRGSYATLGVHIDNVSNPHSVTKSQVGLSNADNTSDLNKPISTATQTALNAKVNNTRNIIAGAGLTGGGTLDSDRTLNVASANDGITVNADNIQLNTIDNVTTTSTTKPLSANQGKVLNDNIAVLAANSLAGTYNVTVAMPLGAGLYYTSTTARTAVPTANRLLGRVITYATANGVWYSERYIGTDVVNWTVVGNWERVPDNSQIVQLSSDSKLNGKVFNNINLSGTFLTNAQIIANAISSLYLYGSGIESNAVYSAVVASNTTSYRRIRIFKAVDSTNTEVCQLHINQSVIKTGIESLVIPSYNSSNVSAKVIVNWDILSGQDILSLYADKWSISDKCKNEAFFNNSYFNAINIATNGAAIPALDAKWEQKNIILDYISDSTFMGVADAGVKPYSGLEVTRITNGTLSDVAGFLQSVTFRTDKAGSIKVKLYAKVGTNFVWQNEVIITVKAGLNTYYAGIDFTPVYVGAGWYLGVYSPNGVKIPYISDVTEQSILISGDHMGSVNSTWGYKYYIAISAKVARSISEIDTINTQISSIEKKTLLTTSTLFSSDFKTGLPTGFVQNGGWTTSSNGLKSPSTGGWGVWAYYDIYTTLDKNTIRARIKVSDVTSKFALIRKTKSGVAGNIGVIDCANKKLQILKTWDGTSTNIPVVAIETNITFDFITNRDYLVELIKDTVDKCTLKITDTITNNTVQVISDYNVTTSLYHGNGWDSPGVISVNGDITVRKFEYISNAPTKPILAIYGDSFIEAVTLLGTVSNRYADKISNALNGNCLICGQGGEHSTGLLRKLQTDFMNFSPKYTFIPIGTNDGNYSVWLANMQAAIAIAESRNSIPILATITIRLDVDHNAFTAQANAWIRSSGYKYADFNLVTTVNNDGVTQDTTLFMDDKVHPTVACHDILYKRFLMDCPEVFDEQ